MGNAGTCVPKRWSNALVADVQSGSHGLAQALGQAETESRAYKEALEARVGELHQAIQPLPPAVVKLKEAIQTVGLSWT